MIRLAAFCLSIALVLECGGSSYNRCSKSVAIPRECRGIFEQFFKNIEAYAKEPASEESIQECICKSEESIRSLEKISGKKLGPVCSTELEKIITTMKSITKVIQALYLSSIEGTLGSRMEEFNFYARTLGSPVSDLIRQKLSSVTGS